MKKTRIVFCVTAIIIFAVQGCSLNAEKDVNRFVVTDRSSGKVLNSYDYSKANGRLLSTASYGDDNTARRITEYEYDTSGELQRTIVSKSISKDIVTEITDYTLKKEYDSERKLVKTVQTSDTGKTIETFYGYDETGTLRGVVERDAYGNVVMMDY